MPKVRDLVYVSEFVENINDVENVASKMSQATHQLWEVNYLDGMNTRSIKSSNFQNVIDSSIDKFRQQVNVVFATPGSDEERDANGIACYNGAKETIYLGSLFKQVPFALQLLALFHEFRHHVAFTKENVESYEFSFEARKGYINFSGRASREETKADKYAALELGVDYAIEALTMLKNIWIKPQQSVKALSEDMKYFEKEIRERIIELNQLKT